MHLGRFHYVTWLISEFFEDNGLLAAIDQTITQLQGYISSPTTEKSQAFREGVESLLELCAEGPLGHNAASIKQIVADTGGEKYFGSGLEHSLREIFEKQSITPADMLVSLQKFRKNFGAYVSSISTIAEELGSLGVEYESLEPGQFEFGAMFPKELVGKTIVDIEDELGHIDRLFKALNEMMGKGSLSPSVRNISSSWWQFFLDLDYKQVAAITLAIERIVALYKSNLEIQKLKREIEKNNLGEEMVALINQKIDEKLKAGMVEIAKEIRQKFQDNKEDGRCNELETQLRMELVHLAKRINQGAAYEVRAGLPIKPKQLAEEDSENEQAILEHSVAMREFEEKNRIATEINIAGSELANSIEELTGETHLLTDYGKLTEIIQDEKVEKN